MNRKERHFLDHLDQMLQAHPRSPLHGYGICDTAEPLTRYLDVALRRLWLDEYSSTDRGWADLDGTTVLNSLSPHLAGEVEEASRRWGVDPMLLVDRHDEIVLNELPQRIAELAFDDIATYWRQILDEAARTLPEIDASTPTLGELGAEQHLELVGRLWGRLVVADDHGDYPYLDPLTGQVIDARLPLIVQSRRLGSVENIDDALLEREFGPGVLRQTCLGQIETDEQFQTIVAAIIEHWRTVLTEELDELT